RRRGRAGAARLGARRRRSEETLVRCRCACRGAGVQARGGRCPGSLGLRRGRRLTRVLFLYSTLTVGGAERQLALLVPELRSRGFDAFVATLRHRGPNFEALGSRGVPVRFVGMRSRTDVAGMVRAYRLWRLKPDVVVTSSVDAQVIGGAVARRARARHVTSEHAG